MSLKRNTRTSYFVDNQNILYLILIILLAAFLRIYNIGVESFWFDEIFTVDRVPQDFQVLMHQLTTQAMMMRNAAYYLFAHFWVLPFDVNETSIRSFSVLSGVLSIGIIYLVGTQLFDPKVGLVSSFLMAISIFQIQHSQEARFYSLFVLLTLVSIYFYLVALKNPGRLWLWTISLIANVLLFYTHTYSVFIFVVEYVYFFIYWRHNKNSLIPWGVSQFLLLFAVVAGFIPLLQTGSLVTDLGGGLAWISRPSLRDLLRTIYGYVFPLNYERGWISIGVNFIVAFTFFISGLLYFSRKHNIVWKSELADWKQKLKSVSQMRSEFVFVLLWFLFPILIPFFYSSLFSPVFVERYTICAAPAFYLLLAVGIVRLTRFIPLWVSLVALMIVIIPGLQDYYVANVNEQWREVAAFVKINREPHDLVFFAPDDDGYQNKSFAWYYKEPFAACGINSHVNDTDEIRAELSKCKFGHQRIWFVMRGSSDFIDRFKQILRDPDQGDLYLIEEYQFVKISVYLFDVR
jgi:mannosyltransferase